MVRKRSKGVQGAPPRSLDDAVKSLLQILSHKCPLGESIPWEASSHCASTRWSVEEKALELMPKAWFDARAGATFTTDPKVDGKTVRAPNGKVLGCHEYWSAGKQSMIRKDHRSCGRRMGQGYATLHGSNALPAPVKRDVAAIGRAERGHPQNSTREVSNVAVPDSAAGFWRS